jgi:hypothetical protein
VLIKRDVVDLSENIKCVLDFICYSIFSPLKSLDRVKWTLVSICFVQWMVYVRTKLFLGKLIYFSDDSKFIVFLFRLDLNRMHSYNIGFTQTKLPQAISEFNKISFTEIWNL